jgi:hypothetical protein
MSESFDAIIIGTGVIGAATAFELAKAGWKTLSIDRNRQAGHGSTAGSCAIVRMHYSTFDGTAFAWEGYHYWRDWADYLGLPASADLARFREVGCLVMINGMAGVTGDMTIETRPLAAGGRACARARGVRFLQRRADRVGQRHRLLLPSRARQQHPDRVGGSALRRMTGSTTATGAPISPTSGPRRPCAMPSGCPAWASQPHAGVVELYDAATDWIPIYDKSSLPGFYMACGTSGNQYKNAPIAGRLMAALIAYCEAATTMTRSR